MAVRKIRIVLIEDSETMRFYYKGVFSKFGFDVLEAETGNKGWQLICDEQPDLIVLDMMLPDTNGFELLKKIRNFEFTREIPVLVLTSVKDIQNIHKALQLGANYYSIKGKDSPEKIQQMIYKLLKKALEKQAAAKAASTDPAEENRSDGEITIDEFLR